jgi:hypothetical protein
MGGLGVAPEVSDITHTQAHTGQCCSDDCTDLQQLQAQQARSLQIRERLAAQPQAHRVGRVWVGRAMDLQLPARLPHGEGVCLPQECGVEEQPQPWSGHRQRVLWVGLTCRSPPISVPNWRPHARSTVGTGAQAPHHHCSSSSSEQRAASSGY